MAFCNHRELKTAISKFPVIAAEEEEKEEEANAS